MLLTRIKLLLLLLLLNTCYINLNFSIFFILNKPIQHFPTVRHSFHILLVTLISKFTVTFFILRFDFSGVKLDTAKFIIFFNSGGVHRTKTL
jgi:hypothetical protein